MWVRVRNRYLLRAVQRVSDCEMTRAPKRPRDTNQLAKMVVDIATGGLEEQQTNAEGQQRGGVLGGTARAAKLSLGRRREIAKMGAQSRWKKVPSVPENSE